MFNMKFNYGDGEVTFDNDGQIHNLNFQNDKNKCFLNNALVSDCIRQEKTLFLYSEWLALFFFFLMKINSVL